MNKIPMKLTISASVPFLLYVPLKKNQLKNLPKKYVSILDLHGPDGLLQQAHEGRSHRQDEDGQAEILVER